jgi:signal transduction histidine kinase/HPt (histidine-containing phosphotransfer) domain-containing protein
VTEAEDREAKARENAMLRGRVAILYAFSQHYMFLPFAALCMAASLTNYDSTIWVTATPLVLLIFATLGGAVMKRSYETRGDDDPRYWARQYTVFSALTGAIWGAGALIWFVPGSFPAQAYLVLAFMGMTAVEFVARGAYRPAYMAHAATSLFPLAALLIIQGGIYAQMTACLLLFFGGVLYTYTGSIGGLLAESILLRYDNAQFVARVREEKAAAEAARDSAQASERAKSSFISSISHEIRTPVNAILGMAQLLERSDLERGQREHVKVLVEAGRGLKILLDDIIALAQQGEDDNALLTEEGCDAGQAARTVVRLLMPNAWEKRLRLTINVPQGLPHAAADPRVLRRVLLKIVGNAIKFTERGTIEIAVDSGLDPDGRSVVRFRVTDTGPGIPSHLIGTIFEPFAKADDSYARRYNGAGVGLSVAKRLVESMRGEMGVDSEPGAGASFWITIPATSVQPTATIEPTEGAVPPSGLSILVYILDPAMRSSVENVLAPFGNRLAFAEDLSEAARLAARGKYSLAIAHGNNVDALAAMPGQHAPILGLARPDERQPDGADTVLAWPATSGDLYNAIHVMTGGADENGSDLLLVDDDQIEAAIDAKAFAELEKSLGLKTLIDILQSYLTTAEDLSRALMTARDAKEWTQAGRVAQDIAGAAGGLGLTALTSAARALAQGARDGSEAEVVSQAAGEVLTQHQRVADALRRIYPDLAA